jgi:hypothetical protein
MTVRREGAGTREDPARIVTDENEASDLLPLPWEHGRLTAEQHDYLLNNLRGARVATLQRSGKSFSHLEAWDVKAHLIRVFGFGNFDIETLDVQHRFTREYTSSQDKPSWEVAYQATVQLTIRDRNGNFLCRYSESSVDSQSGSTALGDLHDNAIKAATSGALKRCATALGTQFGLSLYDDGNTSDIVRVVLVRPDGATKGIPPTSSAAPQADLSPEGRAALEHSLGAEVIAEEPTQHQPDDAPAFDRKIDTTEEAEKAVQAMTEKAARRG